MVLLLLLVVVLLLLFGVVFVIVVVCFLISCTGTICFHIAIKNIQQQETACERSNVLFKSYIIIYNMNDHAHV